ncbi:unnamed protein product, partial [Ectocarpus sp. 12 AP-2014]
LLLICRTYSTKSFTAPLVSGSLATTPYKSSRPASAYVNSVSSGDQSNTIFFHPCAPPRSITSLVVKILKRCILPAAEAHSNECLFSKQATRRKQHTHNNIMQLVSLRL